MSNARTITKTAVRFLARGGAASATANIVASNRNANPDNQVLDTYHQTAAVVGGFAAGWIVGDYVGNFAAIKVDELFDWFDATFKKTA